MSDKESGSAYLYHTSNGNIMKVDTTTYQDDSTTICTEFVTNKYDMDTYKRKFLANLRLVGDSYSSSNPISIRWSDDDYLTWSSFHTIETTDGFPNYARLGCFRRRAFNFKHTENAPLRVESLEVTYYEGDS